MEVKTVPVQQHIARRIKRRRRGTILFPGDFADLGSTEAVKKALLRLSQQGLINRVAFGVYIYPEVSQFLGHALAPTVEEIATAIAARDKSRIIPTGSYALNRLGLSTQMPLNAVYLTDGTPRKVRVGKRSILFKRTAPKNLMTKGNISGLAIQALKAIGAGKVEKQEEEQLLKLLQNEDRKNIEHDMLLAPAWIRDILKKALRHDS